MTIPFSQRMNGGGSGGSRTRSIPRFERGWSAHCLPSQKCSRDGSRTHNTLGITEPLCPLAYPGPASRRTGSHRSSLRFARRGTIHHVRPQDVLPALDHGHPFVELPVVKDKGHPSFWRNQQRWPTLVKRRRPALEAVVQVDHERKVAPLAVGPLEVAVCVWGKSLA